MDLSSKVHQLLIDDLVLVLDMAVISLDLFFEIVTQRIHYCAKSAARFIVIHARCEHKYLGSFNLVGKRHKNVVDEGSLAVDGASLLVCHYLGIEHQKFLTAFDEGTKEAEEHH